MKKILFISHEASRSGAPLLLLHLLKWLNRNSNNIQFDLLLLNDGVILEDFKKECTNVFLYSEIHKPLKLSVLVKKKLCSKFGIKQMNVESLFFKDIVANNYNLIYANTIVSLPLAVKIKSLSLKTKLLVHVHELNTVIKMLIPNFNDYINMVDQYIAVSKLVKSNLIDNYNIEKSKIKLIYEFGVVKHEFVSGKNKIFTVGTSGLAHWRKGDDVFIQVANYINKNYPNAKMKFVWVGNNDSNKLINDGDIGKLNLNEVVSFVGEQENPIQFYVNFDVFLLPSREDPFPLVCIEAATLKKPIVCFEQASGTSEVIEKGGGFAVPYLDIEEMAKKVIYYYENPTKKEEDGELARELFSEFTPEKICPLLYEQINYFLKD